MSDDRYVFIVEWYDSAASIVRTYNLTIFLKDNTIEMVINTYNIFSMI
jgi:nucleoside-diphosphate kinase